MGSWWSGSWWSGEMGEAAGDAAGSGAVDEASKRFGSRVVAVGSGVAAVGGLYIAYQVHQTRQKQYRLETKKGYDSQTDHIEFAVSVCDMFKISRNF